MNETLTVKYRLDPERVENWLDEGYERLFAISWRDYAEVQNIVLKNRFEALKDSVAALGRLAKREGVTTVGNVEDALPLLFDHRIYKTYPLSLIENRDFSKLTDWLNRLTAHDLSKVDLSGLRMLDDWLGRLDEFGMIVIHTSGTTGKLGFIPRSQTELPTWRKTHLEGFRATTGVDIIAEPVPTFVPGYRGGYQMGGRSEYLLGMFESAGGPEHYHTLYQTKMSADLLSLAGRMQAAEDRGELDKLGFDPALIKAHEELIAQAKRRDQDAEAWYLKMIEDFRGKRVKICAISADLIRATRAGIEKGIKPQFGPGSFMLCGGGMKNLKDVPEDWESYVKNYFGVDRIGMFYGMTETCAQSPRCSEKYYHVWPFLIPLLFDRDMKLLPREGTQTGRYAFFDLIAQSYWGGFITGDELTIHWDEDCPCGWKGPRIGPAIKRFSHMETGDDKITCAGTQAAYNDLIDFIADI